MISPKKPTKPRKPTKPSKPNKPSRTMWAEVSCNMWDLVINHSTDKKINIDSLCEKLKTFTNARYHSWYDDNYIVYDKEITLDNRKYNDSMEIYNALLRNYKKDLKVYEEKMVEYQEKLEIYETKLNDYHDYKIKKEVDKLLKQAKKKGLDVTKEEATKIVSLQLKK